MTTSPGSTWITAFLASDPPRSKSLLTTIFGDTIAPHGGEVWLGSLIELLAPFGVNDRLLRTSVFRLAQEGWLGARRDGRRSAYTITPEALGRFVRAYRRIYAPLVVHWDNSWSLVIGGGTSLDAAQRGALRKELLWQGYSLIAPAIYGHPASDAEVLDEIVTRLGVQGKLYICSASELPGVPARPLRELVADGWDVSSVAQGYQHFMTEFEPLLALLDTKTERAPQADFVMRTLLIHAYRRVQLHDPQLPVELLPDPWPGAQAYEMTRTLYRILYRGAEEHIMSTLQREDPAAPPAEASFYQRFGGLD